MTNNNNLNNLKLITENYKKVETVYELKNKLPSFEEFMKTYEPNEEVEIITEAEYQDMLTGFVVGNTMDNLKIPLVLKKGWDSWQEFKDNGCKDKSMVNYHGYHTANGESYSSYCEGVSLNH